MNLQPRHIALVIACLACCIVSVVIGSFAYYSNQGFGFPLDDPWIHLQFAKNLVEHGAFSYFKDEMVTSGSTAPLYTLMLAAGFLLTSQEMILSYVIGVLMYLGAIAFFFRILEHFFPKDRMLIYGGLLLFALEPRLHWVALSGMETTLFVLLLLATFFFYVRKNPIALGIAGGLLLWARPEAVILFGALGADVVFKRLVSEGKAGESGNAWLVKAVAILAIFGAGYALFNFMLSGSVLPNTYAAKLKYYSGTGRNFPADVFDYLTTGPLLILSFFSVLGILLTVAETFRRKSGHGLIPLLFAAGMFLAFWIKLPYLYQNGRYMMPILPFYLMLGLVGLQWAMEWLSSLVGSSRQWLGRLQGALLVVLVVQSGLASWHARTSYQESCRYITDRQVRTALWIRDNLPDSAIVATHDVGAIAYYSERKIVDMVGLVSPEMIERIGDLGLLRDFLVRQNVTHLALLRNWFEVVNIAPLFQTDERVPEIMEVFEFDRERVHFTTGQVSWLTANGGMALARGDVREGGPMLERAVLLDPRSSRARHHFGWALLMAGNFDRAEAEFRKALELYPTYWPAEYALSQVSLRRGQPQEALQRLRALVKANPAMPVAYQSMAQIQAQLGDTAGARISLERLRDLENAIRP